MRMEKRKKMYDVSAFIIARNEEENIDKTLYSLWKQKPTLREIVVINDGSTDNTRSICENYQGVSPTVKIVDLPYHSDSYVGRWELGRSINHGLREIRKSGIPDWILQMGADHVLPNNYVSVLVERMTDEIKVSSGSYEGASLKLNIDTPLGSGKLIAAKLWNEFNGMLYPEKYAYESWIGYRFRKEGYGVSRHDDLITEVRPARMSKRKAYYWGKGSYALGGVLPFAILKAVSLRRHGLKFIQGYFSRKDVEIHDDIFEYVASMQWEKARKQGLSILNKWRKVKI